MNYLVLEFSIEYFQIVVDLTTEVTECKQGIRGHYNVCVCIGIYMYMCGCMYVCVYIYMREVRERESCHNPYVYGLPIWRKKRAEEPLNTKVCIKREVAPHTG